MTEVFDKNEPHRHDWDWEGKCYLCGKGRKEHYDELKKLMDSEFVLLRQLAAIRDKL